jgi:hypothetical protein
VVNDVMTSFHRALTKRAGGTSLASLEYSCSLDAGIIPGKYIWMCIEWSCVYIGSCDGQKDMSGGRYGDKGENVCVMRQTWSSF